MESMGRSHVTMEHPTITDPPAGWSTSTAIDHHVSFVESDTGRSVALMTSENPAAGRWNVLGVAGFENPSPIFAENVDRETALSTASQIMDGDDVEPVAYREPNRPEPDAEHSDDRDDEPTNDTTDTNSAGQVDLSSFTE
jgi:hypothetical protein